MTMFPGSESVSRRRYREMMPKDYSGVYSEKFGVDILHKI